MRILALLICLLLSYPTFAQSWWQETNIYQIYPRSYQDSDGDGIGDLQGIINQLDYIHDMGFETIWISPFYVSPQDDFGYDISDYYHPDPVYGNDALVQSLIEEVHKRDMKIVFDLVLNHTSIEHEWFQESASCDDCAKSDWYVWKDGQGKKGNKAPNNWINVFNKDAWHYHEGREQWYYTAFLESQPDLNWRNPEVKEAMFGVVRHWLDQGVDGFRLDIFNCIMEEENYADNPKIFKMLPSKDAMKASFQRKDNNINHPDNFVLAKELRAVIDEYDQPQRFLVGEAVGPIENLPPLVGKERDGLNLVFLFDLIMFDFKADFFHDLLLEFEELFPPPFTPTLVYGNHDNFRSTRRIDNDLEKAKLLALLQCTARGVPVIYYGEEVGMQNAEIKKKDAKDPISHIYKGLPQFMRNWLPVPVNRDVCRTPMQWTADTLAGFSPPETETWLPISGDHQDRNVATQLADSSSLLHIYRDLLHLRKEAAPLRKGTIRLVSPEKLPKNVLAYERLYDNEIYWIVLNFDEKMQEVEMPNAQASLVFQVQEGDEMKAGKLRLAGLGGMVLKW